MRSNIFGLRQRKIDLAEKNRALLDRAKAEGREFSASEASTFDANIAGLHRIEADIVEAERARETELRTTPESWIAGNGTGQWRAVENQNFKPGVRPKRYAEMFGAATPSGFANLGEYLRAVHFSGQVFDPRLKAAASEGVPSDGGFLVPTEFSQQIIDQALEDEIVRPRAFVWPMTSDTRKVPAISDNDHSSAVLFGGVAAQWANELDSIDEQKVKVRLIELHANKLAMLSNASNELLEDSTFESVLGAKLTAGASWHLDNAFLFGDGAGKPLGVLNAGNKALVTVNKETSQPADGVVYENITKMYAAMAPRNRRNAVWIFNDGLVPALYGMQNRVFNLAGSEVVGGSAVPVFSMNPDGTGTLLTRPCLFSEKMAAPGDLGDAAFIDFSAYAIGVRREVILAKSAHAGFANDSSWYRLTTRVDGQPTWNSTLKPLHGNAQSPYVTLEAR